MSLTHFLNKQCIHNNNSKHSSVKKVTVGHALLELSGGEELGFTDLTFSGYELYASYSYDEMGMLIFNPHAEGMEGGYYWDFTQLRLQKLDWAQDYPLNQRLHLYPLRDGTRRYLLSIPIIEEETQFYLLDLDAEQATKQSVSITGASAWVMAVGNQGTVLFAYREEKAMKVGTFQMMG